MLHQAAISCCTSNLNPPDKKSGIEVFKESPASDARVEEVAKAGQRRPDASEVKCTD